MAITFDDAYEDTPRAVELLRERGLRASVYVTTGQIDSGTMIRREQLEQLARAPETVELGAHTVSHPPLDELEHRGDKARSVRQQASPGADDRTAASTRSPTPSAHMTRACARRSSTPASAPPRRSRTLSPTAMTTLGRSHASPSAPPPARSGSLRFSTAKARPMRGTESGCARAAIEPCASSGAGRDLGVEHGGERCPDASLADVDRVPRTQTPVAVRVIDLEQCPSELQLPLEQRRAIPIGSCWRSYARGAIHLVGALSGESRGRRSHSTGWPLPRCPTDGARSATQRRAPGRPEPGGDSRW